VRGPLAIDRVRFETPEGTIVELRWAVAQELQARLLRAPPAAAIVDRMQRVGTSRPVQVVGDELGPLLVVLAQWAKEVGKERLPSDVEELLDALQFAPGHVRSR
jgi:hypothetical protein